MHTTDFLSLYNEKLIEYVIAIGFLLCFIPFWRYVNGATAAARKVVHVAEPAVSWFQVPAPVFVHPGHAWAQVVAGDLVRVGLDEFGHRLVGAAAGLTLPAAGEKVGQGEVAFALKIDDVALEVLAPVDGEVVKVNDQVAADPKLGAQDPYGAGWLFEVRSSRLAANLKQLVNGDAAKRLLEGAMERLERMASPELGALAHDGGLPVDGMAKALSPNDWQTVAKRFFLTESGTESGGTHA
jgi:glycine cleavage system H lipoate-binding protein